MSFNPKKQLSQFLAEDIGKGDITSQLLSKKKITVKIISRENAIIAGTKYAKEIFAIKGCKAKIITKDGTKIKPNQDVIEITGNADNILTCERTALNILTRMSGIATQTNELVKKIPKKTKLYATRKTAPGLRYFDKEAVKIGGGERHRLRLDEMVMIKDNHIAVEQSLSSLINKTKKKYNKFEVEVENTDDAVLAAEKGATIIMLDNFSPSQITRTIKVVKNKKGEMLSFIADELIASDFIEDHTGSDSFFVEQIGGEIIVEKNSIPHILEDIPEIIDCDLVGSIITYGEFNTLQEAKDFINNLKSISFDSINPEDGQCIRYIH